MGWSRVMLRLGVVCGRKWHVPQLEVCRGVIGHRRCLQSGVCFDDSTEVLSGLAPFAEGHLPRAPAAVLCDDVQSICICW